LSSSLSVKNQRCVGFLKRETTMDRQRADESAERFSAYLDELASVIGHAARVGPMRDYCTGLLLSCERKSVEPIAAATAPAGASAQHQSLLHFLAKGEWSDADVLEKVRDLVLPRIEQHGAIEVWTVDDTGFPKYGSHSVGVSHQYCGQVGKQTNCQIAVSLSLANHHASLPVAYRLYVPENWAKDAARRKKTGIPDEIEFTTKPKMALEQIEWACKIGLPRGVVLMDAGYGHDLSFRKRLVELKLTYSVGIRGAMLVCETGQKVAPNAQSKSAVELAKSLPQAGWCKITWRDGTNTPLSSRFQRVRVRAAGAGTTDEEPEEWLLIEWPEGEKEPTKFWLSTLPETMTLEQMVDITMMRWRIERDYHELIQEVGLGHFEGRGWRGFHRHATMCFAAYGFIRVPLDPASSRRNRPETAVQHGIIDDHPHCDRY
jgi:SRSO17 transposase